MKPVPHTTNRKDSAEQLLAQREEEIARIAELIATMERKLEWEIANRDQIIAREVSEAEKGFRDKVDKEFREEYEKLEKLKKEVELQKESLRKEMELMAMCRLLSE